MAGVMETLTTLLDVFLFKSHKTRTTALELHAVRWKHLQITVVLYRNFFFLEKPVNGTEPL